MIDHQMHWYPRSYFESILDRTRFPRARRDGADGYLFQSSPEQTEWRIAPPYYDLDAALAQAAADGIEAAVISPNLIGDVTWYELGEARETLALLHEEYARAQARLASRFIGLCMLPLQDTAAAIETLDHAIVELGLRGVLMNVAPAGRALVSELTLPVFERIEQLGVPVFLHPANRSLVWDFAAPFGRLAESGLGWMFDTSLAALSLITSGTLDRFPRLVVVRGKDEIDLLNILGAELVLVLAFGVFAVGVDEEHLAAQRVGLVFVHHNDARGNARAIKEARRQADDGLDHVVLDEEFADELFLAAPEQHAVRHDRGHVAVRLEARQHVLDEHEVGFFPGLRAPFAEAGRKLQLGAAVVL